MSQARAVRPRSKFAIGPPKGGWQGDYIACFAFGEFQLDTDERRLSRNGAELRGKLFDTLSVFLQTPGKLLRKGELLARVWPDSIVEENNLDHCVSQCRKILGDEVNRFIETVPRQGYRFVCPVRSHNVIELSGDAGASRRRLLKCHARDPVICYQRWSEHRLLPLRRRSTAC